MAVGSEVKHLRVVPDPFDVATGLEEGRGPILSTSIARRMVARMQRTHARRRASVFVGPPGIGKTTAIDAFRVANPGQVMVARVIKRGATGPQVLQQLLLGLRALNGDDTRYVTNAVSELERYISIQIERAGGGLRRDESEKSFPFVTMVFDEAQRITNAALDALRGYNERHYCCIGTFPIGLIFVGNSELSLKVGENGTTILDAGMDDRLLYKEAYSYEDVATADLETFIRSAGIVRDDVVAAIVRHFDQPRVSRSFRQVSDFIEELRDETGAAPITIDTVRTILA